jgi:hypothetical protein
MPKIGVIFVSVHIVDAEDQNQAIAIANEAGGHCQTIVIASETVESEQLTEKEIIERLKKQIKI